MNHLMPQLIQTFIDEDGAPLVGGKLYTYEASSSTPLATYQTSDLSTSNTNPVVFDANGQANIWLLNQAYKLVLTDADDNILATRDGVAHIPAGSISASDIADGAITTIKLAAEAVTTAKIDDEAVTNQKLGPDAVDGSKIEDESIDSEHYVDGSIDNVHLAGGITEDKLASPRRLQCKKIVSTGLNNVTLPSDILGAAIFLGSGGGGGGGGGGSASGGGGCGGAGSTPQVVSYSVPASTNLAITIGTGGAGGTGVSGATGNAGSGGVATTVTGTGISLYFPGGGGGAAGTASQASPGAANGSWAVNYGGPNASAGGGGSIGSAVVSGATAYRNLFTASPATGGASGTGTPLGGGGGGGGSGFGAGSNGANGVNGGTSSATNASTSNYGAGGGGGGGDWVGSSPGGTGGAGAPGFCFIFCVTAESWEGTV